VNSLANDPSTATRAGPAAKLAVEFNSGRFSASELKLAEQIFRIMVKDAEIRVREALSANLKNNPSVPRDIAVTLAKDVDSVSLPILSLSDVLTTEDLVEIIRSNQSQAKMEAIAGRKTVDADVAESLAEKAGEIALAKLAGNPGADLREGALNRMVDRFPDSEKIQDPMVHRAALPVTIVERLVTRVSDHLRSHLLSKHRISEDMALDLVLQTRERATAGLAMGVTDESLFALVRQLAMNKRLTGSLVLRSLCMGNVRFFEQAVAALSGVPLANTRILVHDSAGSGLKAVWSKAKLSPALFPAVRAALDVVAQTELDGRDLDTDRYTRRIIERILTQYEMFGVEFANDDIEYLLGRVSKLPAASVALH
ncbi:MAG: DUF2336 domain-containing protein, partial [Planctomycetales bacterium]|nr:DUF2336 domain-containing protein [Planctomycetales bacterium]